MRPRAYRIGYWGVLAPFRQYLGLFFVCVILGEDFIRFCGQKLLHYAASDFYSSPLFPPSMGNGSPPVIVCRISITYAKHLLHRNVWRVECRQHGTGTALESSKPGLNSHCQHTITHCRRGAHTQSHTCAARLCLKSFVFSPSRLVF